MIELRKIFEAYTGDSHQLAAIEMLARSMPPEDMCRAPAWLECYQVECEIIETTPFNRKKEWQ